MPAKHEEMMGGKAPAHLLGARNQGHAGVNAAFLCLSDVSCRQKPVCETALSSPDCGDRLVTLAVLQETGPQVVSNLLGAIF